MDYSHMNEKELLCNFKSESWNSLDKEHKLQIIDSVGKFYARELGMREKIDFKEIQKRELYCSLETANIIYINLFEENNPYQILDMIIHEVFHIHQRKQKVEKSNELYIMEMNCIYNVALWMLNKRKDFEEDDLFKDDLFKDDLFKDYLEERIFFFESEFSTYKRKIAHAENFKMPETIIRFKKELKRIYFEYVINQSKDMNLEEKCAEEKIEELLEQKEIQIQCEKFRKEVGENAVLETKNYWQKFILYNQLLIYQFEMLKKTLKEQRKDSELKDAIKDIGDAILQLQKCNKDIKEKTDIDLEEEEW